MTEADVLKALWDRYASAMHAVQSGIAMEVEVSTAEAAATPKHLRVGVNASMVQNDTLVVLLIETGVFTDLEWFTRLAEAAEREALRYEQRLTKLMGCPVELG